MSFAVFSQNDYRCDFWIDRKIEHLNVLGKTDGIFVLDKTLSERTLIGNSLLGSAKLHTIFTSVPFLWFLMSKIQE